MVSPSTVAYTLVSGKYQTQSLDVSQCAADHDAPEQEVLSDHVHHDTWLPHGTEPCECSGDHVSSTIGPDAMCDDKHSTSQPLTGRPVLAIAIGKMYCPSERQ